jgi:phage-related protein
MVRSGTSDTLRRRFRWRDYRTAGGAQPVADFIRRLDREEAAVVLAGMNHVARFGLEAARHLKGEIYEVRVDAAYRSFRLLFAQETKFILLSLNGIVKKTQKTPPNEIVIALARLEDWRKRGRP